MESMGKFENILFELIYFNYRSFRRIYCTEDTFFFCLRKICHEQSILLFRAYDPHTKDIPRGYKILSHARKICRIIHEIFSRAHNTLSRHTLNFDKRFIQNLHYINSL